MKRTISSVNVFYSGSCFSWQHRCVAVRSSAYRCASSASGLKYPLKKSIAISVSALNHLLFIGCILIVFSSCSVSKQIAKQASRILLQDSVISTGHIGISIYEAATNKYWYNYNGDKYFVPASNTKLFTLYAGMKYLGDSLVGLRYKETGDSIIIYPTADPTFLHPDFLQQPVYSFLSDSKKITFCSQYFTSYFGKGWAWDDYQDEYMAQINEFPMYGNMLRVKKLKVNIQIIPKVVSVHISASAYQHYNDSVDLALSRNWEANNFLIDLKSGKASHKKILRSPLVINNVDVISFLNDTLKKDIHLIGEKSVADKHDKQLHAIYSQPVDSLFIPMMHNSDNFFAEQTLLMASNEHLGFMKDEAIIDTLLNHDLKSVPQKPTWVDGSGLSRYNLFTPQSFIYILNKMKNEYGLERLKTILPTGGEGTLKEYYTNDSTFIYAKTGTLGGTIALSGFLITNKNKLLTFSILTNNFKGRTTAVRKAVEKFILQLRKNY